MPDPTLSLHGSPSLSRKRSRLGFKISSSGSSSHSTAAAIPEDPDDPSSNNPSSNVSPKHSRRDSSISSLSELRSNLRRRSTSLRSSRAKSPTADTLALFADSRNASTTSLRPNLNLSTLESGGEGNVGLRPPGSSPFGGPLRRDDVRRPPATSHGILGRSSDTLSTTASGGLTPQAVSPGSHLIAFHQMQDTISRRINTLDYLRKTHESRVYWFNTLAFQRKDLSKLPYFDEQKIIRRASNYLVLGLSLPAALEPYSRRPLDYMRAFNNLMSEFETYQTLHPPEGSGASAFAKVRMPQMFRRATSGPGTKRRASGADSLTSPLEGVDFAMGGLSGTENELLPGEQYNLLLTPSLPFDLDYFETFSTLCDVMIDCYTKVGSFMSSSEAESNAAVVTDLFHKADSKIRKILVQGVMKDFEEACKTGIRAEMAGVGKMVLGPLM